MMKFQSLAGAVLMVGVSTLLLAGCAHDGDVRDSHDNTYGTTAKSPPTYLGCVRSELPAQVKTYEIQSSDSVRLFVESTDPDKADGLVELKGQGPSANTRPTSVTPGTTTEGCLMPLCCARKLDCPRALKQRTSACGTCGSWLTCDGLPSSPLTGDTALRTIKAV